MGLYTFGYSYGNVDIQKDHYQDNFKTVNFANVGLQSSWNAIVWPLFWSIELQWHEYQPSSVVPVECVTTQSQGT